jgi:hypothetical protein
MPVEKRTVAQAWASGKFEPVPKLSKNDFEAGPDDGRSLDAGEIGEFANATVGETSGNLSDVLAVAIGYPPDSNVRTAQGKPNFPIQNGSGSAIAEDTQVRVVARSGSERGGMRVSPWFYVGETDLTRSGVSYQTIEPLPPQTPRIREDKVVAIQLKNESASVTPSFSNSGVFKIPAMEYKE